MVQVYVVHAGQNSLLILSWLAAVQQSRKAGIWVMEDGPFLLLAEVESFFGLEYLRGVGLVGLRGGHTWGRGDERRVIAARSQSGSLQTILLKIPTEIKGLCQENAISQVYRCSRQFFSCQAEIC